MPFKANAARRHHIPKQKRKVTNWAAYDASLRQRASLTVWFSDDAIAGWKAEPRTTRGGQAWYSPLAILTALALRAVFRLAFAPDGRADRFDHQAPRSYPGGFRSPCQIWTTLSLPRSFARWRQSFRKPDK
jgi:Transposase DDE domain